MNALHSTFKISIVFGALYLGAAMIGEAYAQGNGTLGGGQGVYQDGRLRLRDLVDPGTCRWQGGESLLNSMPELQARLEKIKALNWYFELMLKREIRALDFCWTRVDINQAASAMYRNSINESSILIYQTPAALPVGLRVRDAREVYVQESRFQEFGPQDQALFVIHEALHSFMPLSLDSKTYYEKLFSIVRTIGSISGSTLSDVRGFEIALRKSELKVPSSAQYFIDQKFLSYLFESYDGRREMILQKKVTVAELLRPRSFDYASGLAAYDQHKIEYAKRNLTDSLFQEFCMVQDTEVLNAIRQQSHAKFDIDLYCLTSSGALDRIIDDPARLEGGAVKKFIENFYTGLSHVIPSVVRNRLVISKEIDWISGNPAIQPKYRYALEVKSPLIAVNRDDAETHLHQYTKILVAAAMVKSPAPWLEMVKQGSAFKQAFHFKRLETAILAIESPIADESKASALNLRAVYQSAIRGIADRLRAADADEHAELFLKYVNQSDFGFTVND